MQSWSQTHTGVLQYSPNLQCTNPGDTVPTTSCPLGAEEAPEAEVRE